MPWHVKATGWGYTRTSQEAKDNATMVMDILFALGWSIYKDFHLYHILFCTSS